MSQFGAMLVHKMEIILVVFGVKAAQRQNLGYQALTGAAFYVNYYVQRLCDVCLDGAIRNFDAALQYARSEARNTLGRGVSVDGGNGATVPRIQKLKEVESFAAANLA
jgi:hypothetical protein